MEKYPLTSTQARVSGYKVATTYMLYTQVPNPITEPSNPGGKNTKKNVGGDKGQASTQTPFDIHFMPRKSTS
jgi:hypothetical protein